MRSRVRDGECLFNEQSWLCCRLFGYYRMHLCPGKAHNDNDATPAQCNGPKPDRGKPLSANIIGLHILQRTV